MFRVGCLVAAALAAAVSVLCASAARADLFRRDDDTLLFFTGTDLWRQGSFSFAGGLWSPAGLDREGFTFKLLIGAGTYQYFSDALGQTGDQQVTGRQVTGFAMPGYRFVRDKLFVTVFAGLDAQHHTFSPDDPTNKLWGTHLGVRAAVEFWYEPTPLTMWAADASFTTVGASYSGRLAFGWKLFEAFYLGPEVGGFANGDNYRQFRAGLHLTGFRSGAVEWSLAGGWLRDTSDREGLYGRLGLITRR
jgi:hypothetical protein